MCLGKTCTCNIDNLSGSDSEPLRFSVAKIRQGDIKERALLTYAIRPNELFEALEAGGVACYGDCMKSEIVALAELSEKGEDKKGVLKDEENNPIYFDFRKIVGSVKVKKSQLFNGKVKFY